MILCLKTPTSQNTSLQLQIDLMGGVQSALSSFPWTHDSTHAFGLYHSYILGFMSPDCGLMTRLFGLHRLVFSEWRQTDLRFLESEANLTLARLTITVKNQIKRRQEWNKSLEIEWSDGAPGVHFCASSAPLVTESCELINIPLLASASAWTGFLTNTCHWRVVYPTIEGIHNWMEQSQWSLQTNSPISSKCTHTHKWKNKLIDH